MSFLWIRELPYGNIFDTIWQLDGYWRGTQGRNIQSWKKWL
jgi:hypothetical protein